MGDGPPAISRVIVPPLWTLIALAAEVLLARLWPIDVWLPPAARIAGGAIVLGGVGLALWARELFKRAGTGVRPFSPSTEVVARGPYRFTRNPMYLGLTLLLVGVAVMLRALSPFFVPPLFMTVVTLLFIRYEEQHMTRTFGEPYLAFKRRVRRWL